MDKNKEDNSQNKAPFEDFVRAKKAGIPVDMYPLPSGIGKRRLRTTRLGNVRSVLMFLAILAGIFVYFGGLTHKNTETRVEMAQPTTTRSPAPSPQKKAPAIRATQYTTPSTEEHLEDWHKGTLRSGDTITVVPAAQGINYLYFVTLGTKDTFRLTRIYPPELMERTLPPRKFAVRSKTEGLFQVILFGTEYDNTEKLQSLLQQSNAIFGVTQNDDRQARINQLMADISKEFNSEKWTYYALDALPFKP